MDDFNAMKMSRDSVKMAFQCYIYYRPVDEFFFSNM